MPHGPSNAVILPVVFLEMAVMLTVVFPCVYLEMAVMLPVDLVSDNP